MFVLADNPPRIETIYNNFENDAFFLKTLGLNGVCTEWCPTAPKFPSPKVYFPCPLSLCFVSILRLSPSLLHPFLLFVSLLLWVLGGLHFLIQPYGVNYVGAVFKFQYTDLNGRVQLATGTHLLHLSFFLTLSLCLSLFFCCSYSLGTQLPQSTYLSLITPYTLFGLGRTSNYIEQFFFGVPLNTSHFNYWTGSTIPNSQVFLSSPLLPPSLPPAPIRSPFPLLPPPSPSIPLH